MPLTASNKLCLGGVQQWQMQRIIFYDLLVIQYDSVTYSLFRTCFIEFHFINKNDKCSRFSLTINNPNISNIQMLILYNEINMVLQEEIYWQTHIFIVKRSIKSLNNRSFKFVKMRSRERHQKPIACSSSLGGHFASCLKIMFPSLVRKKRVLRCMCLNFMIVTKTWKKQLKER